MTIQINLENIGEPSIYQRNGREVYFDPLREILVVKNPEEIVRQKVIRHLQTALGVPKEMIGNDGKVFLGKLSCDKELTGDQPETNEFIGRMVKYALVRDQFRKQKLAAKNG